MELGNMIFGNSRGEFPVNRNLQDEFCEYLEEMGFDSYGGNSGPDWVFENDTFRVQPYYWGDCTCGYDQAEERWSAANGHDADCYQTELQGRLKVWDIENGFTAIENRAFGRDGDTPMAGFNAETEDADGCTVMSFEPRTDAAMEAWRSASSRRNKFKDHLYSELSAKYGVDPRYGAAVHCTCTHRARWEAFCETNGHADTCLSATPNFLFKPTGFRLDWYKYPLRDSYSSEKLTRKLMRAMFADCAASLTRDSDTHRQAETAQTGSVHG